MEHLGRVDAIVGLQRGDEGKGRFVDMLMADYDIGARFNGGPNAGHTVVTPEGQEFKLHGIPSGITYPGKKNVIGDGAFVDALKLNVEMGELRDGGIEVSPDNLLISSSAHMILPHHIVEDIKREGGYKQDTGEKPQGSTKSGIAQVDADFGARKSIRAEIINNDLGGLFEAVKTGLERTGSLDMVDDETKDKLGLVGDNPIESCAKKYTEQAKKLGEYVTDTMLFVNFALEEGQNVLAEGAQAFLLDKYQGMWPHVTSSITTSGGISPGLGVPPHTIGKVIGIAKSIPSHVGGGHFVTKITDPVLLKRIRGNPNAKDAERGATTGRDREVGNMDFPILRRAIMANGATEIGVTKLDWLRRYFLEGVNETIPICVAYERKGKILPYAPNAEYKLQQCTPIYENIPGWNANVSNTRKFASLPEEARNYISFFEAHLQRHVTMIGVGQRRDQVIVRDKSTMVSFPHKISANV